jgi:hypothetical protein
MASAEKSKQSLKMMDQNEIKNKVEHLIALLLSDEELTESHHETIFHFMNADDDGLLWEEIAIRYCSSLSASDHPALTDPEFVARMWREIVMKLDISLCCPVG